MRADHSMKKADSPNRERVKHLLSPLVQEYLALLAGDDDDEYYMSSEELAEWQLEKFLTWLHDGTIE